LLINSNLTDDNYERLLGGFRFEVFEEELSNEILAIGEVVKIALDTAILLSGAPILGSSLVLYGRLNVCREDEKCAQSSGLSKYELKKRPLSFTMKRWRRQSAQGIASSYRLRFEHCQRSGIQTLKKVGAKWDDRAEKKYDRSH